MKIHVRLVAALYVIWGALSLLISLALLSLGVGAATLDGGPARAPTGDTLAVSVAASLFVVLASIVFVWAIAHLWNGVALRRCGHLARAVALVLAVLNLFLLPFGTALGVYALWVLLNEQTRPLFERAR